jgi:sialate O-acetylesterase
VTLRKGELSVIAIAHAQNYNDAVNDSATSFFRLDLPMKCRNVLRFLTSALFATIFVAAVAVLPAAANVKLPAVLGSHMVMQRNVPLPIWGTAAAGEKVTVDLDGNKASTVADAKGNWKVTLKPMKADGKPKKLTVTGKNTVTLEDILIGEVWIGSGQSNMEWSLGASASAKKAIPAADHPNIRLFHVPKKQAGKPAADVNAAWKVCTPKSVPRFSGVLYFFGARLHKDLDVPVGLINSSWGGSPIEPWTITAKGSGGMYNGMIAPLVPFPAKGAIWYQGETNVLHKNGLKYRGKMKDLIEGWRGVWKNDKFSFYFVQIAPWSRYGNGELPKLWEAQTATLKLPHTGMAVTTDLVPNLGDIHPRNKVDVGNRLALWALTKDYGKKNIVYSGPLFTKQEVEGKKIRLHFAHAEGGLKSSDGKPLSHFQIAGKDGKFVAATGTIDGKTVVVSADGVDAPAHVRFGWISTARPNFFNAAGLPASPFQTNKWQGGTGE